MSEVVFGNVTAGHNWKMTGGSLRQCAVNVLPISVKGPSIKQVGRWFRKQTPTLANQAAHQYDVFMVYEGLDWEDMVDTCTVWLEGTRYRSAVHFRSMSFYTTLGF